jgi:hypothetical protein
MPNTVLKKLICLRPPLLILPPPFHTVYVYNIHLFTQGRGGGELTREKVREAMFTKPVENTNMTDCISSL